MSGLALPNAGSSSKPMQRNDDALVKVDTGAPTGGNDAEEIVPTLQFVQALGEGSWLNMQKHRRYCEFGMSIGPEDNRAACEKCRVQP